jgi:hypothetical protein
MIIGSKRFFVFSLSISGIFGKIIVSIFIILFRYNRVIFKHSRNIAGDNFNPVDVLFRLEKFRESFGSNFDLAFHEVSK